MTQLQYLVPFVEVAKCESFSVAAERLGVTPSAISKCIARLERELGMRLFNRNTRQLHLTSEGSVFFKEISATIETIDNAFENARNTMAEPSGLVRVAVGATFGRYCLLPVIADFFLQYPKVKLEFDFDDTPKKMLERGFDVEIRYGHGRQTSYISRLLLSDFPMVLVASPLYLARRGVPQSLDDLSQYDYISAIFVGNVSNWKLMRVQAQPKKKIGMNKKKELAPVPQGGRLTVAAQYDTSLIAALYGAGIAPSALPAARPYLEDGRLKIILPDYRIRNVHPSDNQVFIQYPHREHLPPKIRVFVDYLLEKFRSNEDSILDIPSHFIANSA